MVYHDVEEQLKEHDWLFLEELMRYERQQHMGVAPYERTASVKIRPTFFTSARS